MICLHSLRARGCLLVWALLLGTVSTPAQEATQGSEKIRPGDVQTDASRVYVFVDKTGLGHQHGVAAKLASSTLSLGAGENAGRLVFDMSSFDADTPAARKYVGLSGTTDAGTRSKVNKNMRGSAVLNARKYPTATLEVESAKATGVTSRRGLPTYRLVGRFTLHGTARPMTILVEAEQARGWLHVRGNFTINQTSYGITPYSTAFGAVGVADRLKIYGDLFVAPTEHVAMTDIPSRQ